MPDSHCTLPEAKNQSYESETEKKKCRVEQAFARRIKINPPPREVPAKMPESKKSKDILLRILTKKDVQK